MSAFVAALAALAPLLMSWISDDIAPPWPDNAVKMATGFSLLTATLSFLFARQRPARAHGAAAGLLVVGVLLLVGYILLHVHVVERLDDETVLVKGFGLTKEASDALLRHGRKAHDTRFLIGQFGYESAVDIWRWHEAARALLFISFMATAALLAAAVAQLVPLPVRRRV